MAGKVLVLGDPSTAYQEASIYVSEGLDERIVRGVNEAGGDYVVASYLMLPIRDGAVDVVVMDSVGGPETVVKIFNEAVRVAKDELVVMQWQPEKGWSTTPMFVSGLAVVRNKLRALASGYSHEYREEGARYTYIIRINRRVSNPS